MKVNPLVKFKINEKERKVLVCLAADADLAYYFRHIVKDTKLELAEVRRACRSLAKKGYAEYRRGLFDEEGMAAGSGYMATHEGELAVNGCKDCHIRVADMVTGQCQPCWEVVETKEQLQDMEMRGISTGHLEIAKVSLCDLDILKKHHAKNGSPKLGPKTALAQVNRLVKPYNRKYSI